MSDRPLDLIAIDGCCAARLAKALGKRKVNGDIWECPGCGVEWRAELQVAEGTPYRVWSPYCPVAVFRPRPC